MYFYSHVKNIGAHIYNYVQAVYLFWNFQMFMSLKNVAIKILKH